MRARSPGLSASSEASNQPTNSSRAEGICGENLFERLHQFRHSLVAGQPAHETNHRNIARECPDSFVTESRTGRIVLHIDPVAASSSDQFAASPQSQTQRQRLVTQALAVAHHPIGARCSNALGRKQNKLLDRRSEFQAAGRGACKCAPEHHTSAPPGFPAVPPWGC